MKEEGVYVRQKYSRIPQDDLERMVYEIGTENPNLGEKLTSARLAQMGFLVQRDRVRAAITAVFGHRNFRRRLKRRVYAVRGPRSLYHTDTCHHLIKYID